MPSKGEPLRLGSNTSPIVFVVAMLALACIGAALLIVGYAR